MSKFIREQLERFLIKIQPMRINDSLILIEGLPAPAHDLQAQIDEYEAEIDHIRIKLQQIIDRGI